MELRQPKQTLVGKMVSGIEEEHGVKRFWERKIDPGDSPHQNKEKTPKSQRDLQVPTDQRKMCSPIHGQAATPVFNAWPQYNCPLKKKRGMSNRANPVFKPPVGPGREILL